MWGNICLAIVYDVILDNLNTFVKEKVNKSHTSQRINEMANTLRFTNLTFMEIVPSKWTLKNKAIRRIRQMLG